MPQQKFRLIALDMDGTLLMSDKSIHPDTIRDIRQAAQLGVQAVFCSGRGLAELEEYLAPLSMMRYAVCMSGAMVYDLKEDKAVSLRLIPYDQVRQILKTAEKYGAMPHFLTQKESIVRQDQIHIMSRFHMGIYQEMYERVARVTGNMEEEARQQDGIPKVNLYFRSAGDRELGYRQLQHMPFAFAFSEETSLEMNAAGVSKASGLSCLAEYLGISMTEVIGIGDAENDLPMLESVGYPVAMANAEKKIRDRCRLVTDDNDHNGAGKAIRRILGLN